MRPAWRVVFAISFAALAGCATSRPAPMKMRLSAALVIWPKTGDVCDFEHDDRDTAVVITTTIQEVVGTRASLSSGRSYVVRDAQLVRPVSPGGTLCASVIRLHGFRRYDAVYGFEVLLAEGGAMTLTPVYARRSGRPAGPADVSLAIAVAETAGDELKQVGMTRLRFGLVPTDRAIAVATPTAALSLPQAPWRRFAVIVSEGRAAPVTDADLIRTLGERYRWDLDL